MRSAEAPGASLLQRLALLLRFLFSTISSEIRVGAEIRLWNYKVEFNSVTQRFLIDAMPTIPRPLEDKAESSLSDK